MAAAAFAASQAAFAQTDATASADPATAKVVSQDASAPVPQAPLAEAPKPQEEVSPQIDVGPPPVVEKTDLMDPAVVGFLTECVAAVNAAPGDAEKRQDLGIAYEANTIWSLAEQAYDQVLELTPDDAQWRFRRGVVRMANGKLDAALTDLGAAAEAYKNTPVVQARYGDALRVAGELEKAEAAWRQAIAAEESQQPAIKYPQSRVGLAQTLLDMDTPAEAEALCREAIGIAPQYMHSQYILGLALRDQDRDDEANAALALGANSFPGFPPDPHGQRIDSAARGFSRSMMVIENLVQGQQIAEAQRRLDEMLTARPGDFMVLNLAARVALRMQDVNKARTLLEKSLEISPNEPTTLIEACLLELQLADQASMNIGQMIQAQQQGRPLTQEQVDAAREQGLVPAKKAVAFATSAATNAPLVGRNYFWLGMSQKVQAMLTTDQQAQGQLMQTSLNAMKRAGELGCTEPSFDLQMAQMCMQMGQQGPLRVHTKRHLDANPTDPGALWFAIQVEFALLSSARANETDPIDPKTALPLIARLEKVAMETKNAATLQQTIQGYLTANAFDEAEAVLSAFEEAAAGNPAAAEFVVGVQTFIQNGRAQKAAAEGGGTGNGAGNGAPDAEAPDAKDKKQAVPANQGGGGKR